MARPRPVPAGSRQPLLRTATSPPRQLPLACRRIETGPRSLSRSVGQSCLRAAAWRRSDGRCNVKPVRPRPRAGEQKRGRPAGAPSSPTVRPHRERTPPCRWQRACTSGLDRKAARRRRAPGTGEKTPSQASRRHRAPRPGFAVHPAGHVIPEEVRPPAAGAPYYLHDRAEPYRRDARGHAPRRGRSRAPSFARGDGRRPCSPSRPPPCSSGGSAAAEPGRHRDQEPHPDRRLPSSGPRLGGDV